MANELLLLACVIGNVGLTISIKYVAQALPNEWNVAALFGLLLHPAVWVGAVGVGVAAVTFLLAARTMPISIAYAVVTGGTMLGTVLVERMAFGESLGVTSLAGIAMITAGVIMVTR